METTERKQKLAQEYLEATYLVRKNVGVRDLAYVHKPSIYPKESQPSRRNNNCVDHALKDLELLHFFLLHMKPRYRSKILTSDQFNTIIQDTLDIGISKFNDLTQQEKEQYLALAIQMFNYSLKTLLTNLPSEFAKPLVNQARPLNDLMESIYSYMKKSNDKEIPDFRKVDFMIT